MRDRTSSLLLSIPLIAVLATGCSEQATPSSPDAKANQPVVSQPQPTKGKKAAKRPKVIGELTGPSQLVD